VLNHIINHIVKEHSHTHPTYQNISWFISKRATSIITKQMILIDVPYYRIVRCTIECMRKHMPAYLDEKHLSNQYNDERVRCRVSGIDGLEIFLEGWIGWDMEQGGSFVDKIRWARESRCCRG
jgi:hypothetical protein